MVWCIYYARHLGVLALEMRYTRQYDKTSCGPVALVNALKWAGMKVPWRDSKQHWIKLTRCRNGTSPQDLNIAIRQYFPNARRIKPHIRKIERHLKNGGGIIIHVMGKNPRFNHWAFLDSVSPNGQVFGVVNFYKSAPARHGLFRKDLISYLRSRAIFEPWLLLKEDLNA